MISAVGPDDYALMPSGTRAAMSSAACRGRGRGRFVGISRGRKWRGEASERSTACASRSGSTILPNKRSRASSKGGTAFDCIPEPRPSHLENLGENRAREERGVLDDDIVAFVFERDSDLLEEVVGGLADHHGRHELSADPCAPYFESAPPSRGFVSEKDSQAPPPGATAASRIVMRRSGRSLASV